MATQIQAIEKIDHKELLFLRRQMRMERSIHFKKPNAGKAFERELWEIGNFGCALVLWLILTSIVNFSDGLVSHVITLQPEFNYRCKIKQLETVWTEDQIKDFTVPTTERQNSSCKYYDYNYEEVYKLSFEDAKAKYTDKPAVKDCDDVKVTLPQSNETQKLNENSFFQWKFICRIGPNSNYIEYNLARALGAFVSGISADVFGRLQAFRYFLIIQISGWILYVLFESILTTIFMGAFLRAFGGIGIFITGITLLLEYANPQTRCAVGLLFYLPNSLHFFLISSLVDGNYTWIFRDRVFGALNLFLLISFFVLPESPRWLMLRGRNQEAWNMVHKAANIKDHTHSETEPLLVTITDESGLQGLQLYVFRVKQTLIILTHWEFLRRAINLWIVWSFVNLISASKLEKQHIITVLSMSMYLVIMGISSIFSCLIPLVFTNILHRKTVICIFLILSAVMQYTFVFLETGTPEQISAAVGSRLLINAADAIIIVVTAELFPTVCRSTMISLCIVTSEISHFILQAFLVPALYNFNPQALGIFFGVIVSIMVFQILMLPETRNEIISDTLDEAIEYSRMAHRKTGFGNCLRSFPCYHEDE